MEIIIELCVDDILIAIDYYVGILENFQIKFSNQKNALLIFNHNNKILLRLKKDDYTYKSSGVSIQVPNAEKLFDLVSKKEIVGYGILKKAYSFQNQHITFLSAPPGDYFYSIDPSGNKIQFFDKFEERY